MQVNKYYQRPEDFLKHVHYSEENTSQQWGDHDQIQSANLRSKEQYKTNILFLSIGGSNFNTNPSSYTSNLVLR